MVGTSRGLTARHQAILNYLDERLETGYSPSLREIGEAVDISSTSTVIIYLNQLQEWGYIERDKKVSRSIRIAGLKNRNIIRIPIMGLVAAGVPIMVHASAETYIGDQIDGVDVARSMLPVGEKGIDLFALKVQGESMVDALVNDGDIVIMKKTRQVSNGDLVLVWLLEKEVTTLKYFFKEKDSIAYNRQTLPCLQYIYREMSHWR